MNTMVVLWPTIMGAIGFLITTYTFIGLKTLLAHRTPPIPTTMAVMGAIIVAILYFMLVWYITHIKVRRVLYYKKSFWGPRVCKGYTYWRIGFGFGFLEIGGSCAGLYLPETEAIPGHPRPLKASEFLELSKKHKK